MVFGASQGSVLGPLLLNTDICDLFLSNEDVDFVLLMLMIPLLSLQEETLIKLYLNLKLFYSISLNGSYKIINMKAN